MPRAGLLGGERAAPDRPCLALRAAALAEVRASARPHTRRRRSRDADGDALARADRAACALPAARSAATAAPACSCARASAPPRRRSRWPGLWPRRAASGRGGPWRRARAPRSARNCTTRSAPRCAAPCSAVSPRSLAAFTSAPCSSISFIASMLSSSVPRLEMSAQLSPAAAISGVVLVLGRPCADRRRGRAGSRIMRTSEVVAAFMNGVEPMVRLALPSESCWMANPRAVSRALGLAPRSSSSAAMPTASSSPDGCGLGRLNSHSSDSCPPRGTAPLRPLRSAALTLAPVLHEHGRHVVVAVDDRHHQRRDAVRLGGLEVRRRPRRAAPRRLRIRYCAAKCSAVNPPFGKLLCADWNEVSDPRGRGGWPGHTFERAFTSAPARRSAAAIGGLVVAAAHISAVCSCQDFPRLGIGAERQQRSARRPGCRIASQS